MLDHICERSRLSDRAHNALNDSQLLNFFTTIEQYLIVGYGFL